ncbi:hypothetical protein SprV_0401568800 [Sparganum proliferum]
MTFRIQRGTREEVVGVDRPRDAVPDTLPDESSGSIPPAYLLDRLSLRPVSSLFPHIRYSQLQLPPHQPPTP